MLKRGAKGDRLHEYVRHEGNNELANMLTAARAEEKIEAAKAKK